MRCAAMDIFSCCWWFRGVVFKNIYFPCVHLHFLVKQGDRGKRGRSKKCQSGAPGTPGHRGENVRHTALASLHSFLRAHLWFRNIPSSILFPVTFTELKYIILLYIHNKQHKYSFKSTIHIHIAGGTGSVCFSCQNLCLVLLAKLGRQK